MSSLKVWLAKNEKRLPGARSDRGLRRSTKTPRDLRRVAEDRTRSFCGSIPHSEVVHEKATRMSVRQRAHYQREGMWPQPETGQ